MRSELLTANLDSFLKGWGPNSQFGKSNLFAVPLTMGFLFSYQKIPSLSMHGMTILLEIKGCSETATEVTDIHVTKDDAASAPRNRGIQENVRLEHSSATVSKQSIANTGILCNGTFVSNFGSYASN